MKGRADLLALDNGSTVDAVPAPDVIRRAALLGYSFDESVIDKKKETQQVDQREDLVSESPLVSPEPDALPLKSVTFLCPQELELLKFSDEKQSDPDPSGRRVANYWENKPTGSPALKHFANDRVLEKLLRGFVAPFARQRRVDIPKAVRCLAEGRHLEKLPHKERRKQAARLQIVIDRSPHLLPFWGMASEILLWLRENCSSSLQCFVFDGINREFVIERKGLLVTSEPDPALGPVLVMGDVGAYVDDGRNARDIWKSLARTFSQAGVKPFVFFPGSPGTYISELHRAWNVICTDQKSAPRNVFEASELLLTLVSPANRLEPGLLSQMRQTFFPDGGIYLDIQTWNHPAVEHPSAVAASWSVNEIAKYREGFGKLPKDTQMNALEILRQWRRDLPDEIYFEELLNLPQASKTILEQSYRQDFKNARAYFRSLKTALQAAQGAGSVNMCAWLSRVADRGKESLEESSVCSVVTEAKRRYDPHYNPPVPPDKVDRGDIDVSQVDLGLSHRGIEVQVSATSSGKPVASPLASLPSTNGVVEIDDWRACDGLDEGGFWAAGHAPHWAEDWGIDEFGPWAQFSVFVRDEDREDQSETILNQTYRVTQILRWIPPGRFLMGSPESEPGRWDDEGPQHERSIEKGFWLFETPVTQALWQAVMQSARGNFGGAERPVESVSWTDATEFVDELNAQVPGLDLALPSEAEWEYACRAGTSGPDYGVSGSKTSQSMYSGTPETASDSNNPSSAKVLPEHPFFDPEPDDDEREFQEHEADDEGVRDSLESIAWYDENAGGETHSVAQKQPNDFGLYDMIGNVDEWCQDHWHENYEGAPNDGSAWLDQASSESDGEPDRVFRGGSWLDGARYVRSAYRGVYVPSGRIGGLGFRCAARSGEVRPAARSALGRRAWPVTRGRSRVEQAKALPGSAHSDARRAVVDLSNPAGTIALSPLPTTRVLIRTDRASLTLAPMTQPDWASSFGRDRFGLYADVTIEQVTQKLRWIPPGGFLMGSPDEEAGRDDDEGPQRNVTIGTGFWLFDTPVTQKLWEAVLGDNPSEFLHPDRPVERVDWNQAKSFCEAISGRIAALHFDLPSEAEWEYACRAGTQEATYSGPMDILGEHNAPILDEVAWYGGNCGRDFDLKDGFDISDWNERQYAKDRKGGSRVVGLKRPNGFGLYDMLGNVWEWCEDHWHGSYEGAPEDGSAWLDRVSSESDGGPDRVSRGGSWYDEARLVRSAYRLGDGPSYRDDVLGFRCAARPGGRGARSARESEDGGGLAEDARAEPRGAGQTGTVQRAGKGGEKNPQQMPKVQKSQALKPQRK